jgi:protein gp37
MKLRAPKMIFVNSMSDLFHKNVPFDFVDRVFETMEQANWHTFQVLTKRSSRLRNYVNCRYEGQGVPTHIWLGTSVEDGTKLSRVEHLRQIVRGIKFLSIEPLIGRIGKIDLGGIDWVIVGGESGPGFRPVEEEWVTEIRDQCLAAGVAFFFKQWGGLRPKSNGRELEEREWNEMPCAKLPRGSRSNTTLVAKK